MENGNGFSGVTVLPRNNANRAPPSVGAGGDDDNSTKRSGRPSPSTSSTWRRVRSDSVTPGHTGGESASGSWSPGGVGGTVGGSRSHTPSRESLPQNRRRSNCG